MKHTVKFLPLALCAALLLSLPALAAADDAAVPAIETVAPVRVWGTVKKLENGALELKNSDEKDAYNHIILHLRETTPCVDAVLGVPVSMAEVKDGDTVCAWVGPAMTMSLPPQSAALAVVVNLPADYAAPQYYRVIGEGSSDGKAMSLPVAGGETLAVPLSAEVKPYRTNNYVTVEDLVPGSQFLAWQEDGAVRRIVLLPYEYRGRCMLNAAGDVFVDGEKLDVSAKAAGSGLLPVRAVAEAVGCDVTWVKGQGVVVRSGDDTLFTVLPGGDVAKRPGNEAGDWELRSPCVYEKGVTYLSAYDLTLLLDLFFYA